MSTSWKVTIVPLIAFLVGFAYSVVSGKDLSPEQLELLRMLIYGFLGSGTIGAGLSVGKALANRKPA